MSPPIGRLALFTLVALLFVLACDSGVPTEEPCEPGRIIPGEYVVTLQDTTEDVPRAARRLADEVGGEVMGTWMNVAKGFGIKGITDADAEALRGRPIVESVSPNSILCTGNASPLQEGVGESRV